MQKIEDKLQEMEKKYLKNALERCIVCYEDNTEAPCTFKCVEQYFSFMKLK